MDIINYSLTDSEEIRISMNPAKPIFRYPPSSVINCSMTGELLKKSGIIFDFFSYFTSYNNFSHEFRCVSMTRSQRLLNGSWTGTIGKIDREECHMVLLPYGVLYERSKYLTFATPFYTYGVLLLSGEPTSTVRPAVEQFLRTNPAILISILLGILILTVIIGIIEKTSDPASTSCFGNYLYVLVVDLMALFNDPNGILLLFKSYQSILILVLWRFSILIIQIHLGARVNAELVISKTYLIDDYRDVLNRPELQPLIYNNTILHSHFSNAEIVEERGLWRQLERTKGLINRNELKYYRHDISRGKSVLIGNTFEFVSALPLLCHDTEPQPRLHVSRRSSTFFSYAIPVSRSFPKHLLENLNVLTRSFVEFAHGEQFMRKLFSKYSFCLWKANDLKSFENNKNVHFFLYLWSSAIWISTLVFIAELLVFHFEGKVRVVALSILTIISAIGIFVWSQITPT